LLPQIGTAYRNEIAPRGGLLRVREFTMAEIGVWFMHGASPPGFRSYFLHRTPALPCPPEHFVHPDRKAHPKFASVSGLRFNLFPAANQVGDGKIITPTLGEAVASGLIDNETLAYFVGRTALFLQRVREEE
jgi:glycyl-tRNA synthetase